MSDAVDRVSAKLDELNREIAGLSDGVISDLRDMKQYNRNTVLIIMVLWGIGIPLVLYGSLIYAGYHP